MQITTVSSRAGLERNERFGISLRSSAGLLAVLSLAAAHVSAASIKAPPDSEAGMAFARYVAVVRGQDPFTDSSPVLLYIEASLSSLYKNAELLAMRRMGETEQSEYNLISFQGDGTVAEEVIDRYVSMCHVLEELPASSVAIIPGNYNFRFRGEVKTGPGTAYIYDISPRKKRAGLVKGQIWIDSHSGAEVFLAGRLIAPNSIPGGVDVVRETAVSADASLIRTTHLAFTVPQLGRSELAIVERTLQPDQPAVDQPVPNLRSHLDKPR